MLRVHNLVHPFISISKIYPIEIYGEESSTISVIGGNGSGKTTFLKLLLAELLPTLGGITINSNTAFLGTKNGLKPQVILGKQIPFFMSGNTNFPWPQFLGMRFQDLSKGQQRLVALWIVLQKPSSIALIDEPFAHLDANSKNLVSEWVNSRTALKKLTILTHHNLEELKAINNQQILDLNF